ncbi:MAG: endonuclease domain-containing protein [Saprospirales bacterium]|nr:endonuclease domain-containing protein [Saprospirales bacterium]MBK8490942.1 endonuclease domain-containing protein [Saprospirales bacterium]
MSYSKILLLARQLRKNQTPAESCFWEKVRRNQLLDKKFDRQFIIQHSEILGRKKYFIADFYCHAHKLIVEIDGDIHLQQVEYDKIREDILRQMGFTVLRFKNGEVLNEWEMVEARLKEILG